MPGRQSPGDVRHGGHPLGGALHRHRHAGGDGILVHEHHPGRDSRRRFRHRLPAAEVVAAAADQPHLRRAADDLHPRLRRGPRVPLPRRAGARALHVLRLGDLTTRRKAMSDLARALAAALGMSILLAPTVAPAQQPPLKMTLFGQPSVNNDAIWMAFEKGFYQQEGLDVTYRLFPSGTTAFQAFQTGQGDIVMTGDLPSVQYFFRVKGDYRTIAAIERDAKGYVVVARKDITKPQDLAGKTIATRVGSTGSWFISEYLTKNGVDPAKVTVKNLDTQVLPAALCGGEIAAFFIWQPVGSRTLEICPDKAHYLSDATGYIQGYLVAGARPEWLASPQG